MDSWVCKRQFPSVHDSDEGVAEWQAQYPADWTMTIQQDGTSGGTAIGWRSRHCECNHNSRCPRQSQVFHQARKIHLAERMSQTEGTASGTYVILEVTHSTPMTCASCNMLCIRTRCTVFKGSKSSIGTRKQMALTALT
jgi:hypothetical protein